MKARHPWIAALALSLMAAIPAAAFDVVPAASKPGVLLRFLGTPDENTATSASYHKGFLGYAIQRDGKTIATVPLNLSASDLLTLRQSLFTDAEWTAVVKTTNDILTGAKLSPTDSVPADWVAAVKAAPSLAQGLEFRDWRFAALLSRAYLDPTPPAGSHTYTVLGYELARFPLTGTFALNGVGPITIDPATHTVVNPPRLWNATPGIAQGGTSLKATDTPIDGTPDASLVVREWDEKANDAVYLKLAGPPVPIFLPPGFKPGPQYVAFGYDIERAPATGATLTTPPDPASPDWKRVNASPVLIVKTPAEVPATPPAEILDALKAEISDDVANARLPGPQPLDAKKTTLALQDWNTSRTRASASTFRNLDFDYSDRGADLVPVAGKDPDPAQWGPNVKYWYRIHGLNGFGEDGLASPVIRIAPYWTIKPMPPGNLTAMKTGTNQVTLQWQAAAVPTPAPPAGKRFTWLQPVAYRVYRWAGSPGFPDRPVDPLTNPSGPGQVVAQVAASTLTVVDTGQIVSSPPITLQPGATYWYRIVSVDQYGNFSLPSGSAWAILYDEQAPGAPGGVTVQGVPCNQVRQGGGNTAPTLVPNQVPTGPPANTPPGSTVGGANGDKCPCDYLAATPVRGGVGGVTNLPAAGGSALISWTSPGDPDVAGYLVYRAHAVSEDPANPCPNKPGPMEFIGQTTNPFFVDPYLPTDPTPVFYGVRAIDKDRNVGPPTLFPIPVMLAGSQPTPEPGFVSATAVGPAMPPGPWHVDLKWDASVPAGASYSYELWRAETNIPETAALPGGLPPESALHLIASGAVGSPGSLPVAFTDMGVAPGPDDLPTDYWYVVVLKDPTGLQLPARSKPQYVKVGGDVNEPEHKVIPFPWAAMNPVTTNTDATGSRALLNWTGFPWQKLSWVDPTQTLSSVLQTEAKTDPTGTPGADFRQEPIDYAVFRSGSGPAGNFRQVSPLIRQLRWLDQDVHGGKVYYYEVLAFDPITKELVGFTDPVQQASFVTLILLPPPTVILPVPNVTFPFTLSAGQSVAFPLTLAANSQQRFDTTGTGTVRVDVLETAGPTTTTPASKTAAPPTSLVMSIDATAATYQLQVTAVGGPAQGVVTRTGMAGGPIVILLPEALKELRAAPLGGFVPVPEPDGTLKEVAKGDLTGDGKITVADVVLQLESIVGLRSLSPIDSASADANGDGSVTVADAILALRFAVGLGP